jgi:AcrR family transcriptional regulator
MRYSAEHKEESRRKLLAEAGRAFRRKGYGMIGVDGLAKSANVTSGAFYVHFQSKKQAFVEALREGLEELREGIAAFRVEGGEKWLRKFSRFYLGEKRNCELGDACGLATLTGEVERAGKEARTVYEAKLQEIVAELADGLTGAPKQRSKQAWAHLAI